jgi:hypothetical protein
MTFNPTALRAYLIQRLSERTTWIGVIGLFTAVGWQISPDLQNQIASLGVSVVGLILIFTSDKPATPTVVNTVTVTKAS